MIWVVETKLTLGLDVLSQAHGWLGQAHLVSVAVPWRRRTRGNEFAETVAGEFGIGVLRVCGPHLGRHAHLERDRAERVEEWSRPRFRRSVGSWLRSSLRPEQQTYAAAGNAEGKRYTAFNATCDELRRILGNHGPLTIKQAVACLGSRHHYANEASARSSLHRWASRGVIEGVEVEHVGRGKPDLIRLSRKDVDRGEVGSALNVAEQRPG